MLPTKPLNTDYLHQYSRELALQLSNKFFANTDVITGEQIVEFSNIKQINFLVLKILEERWEAEAMRLESPFFDYTGTEVQEGLRIFLNILSKHMRVQKKTFVAVLIEAVYDTLHLVLDPRTYYEQEIQKNSKVKVTAESYRRIIKYLQYNREIFKTFVGEIALRYPSSFETQEAMTVWQNTLRDHWRYIEPIEWRVKAFSNLLNLNLDEVYTRAEDESLYKVEVLPAVEVEEEVVEDIVATPLPAVEVEEEVVEDIVATPLPAVEVEEEVVADIVATPLPAVEVEEEVVEDIVATPLPAVEVEEEVVADIVATPLPAVEVEEEVVADIVATPLPAVEVAKEVIESKPENIVAQYRQDKVNSLLEAIPLHEKFTFIDELFGGDNLAFQDALEKIDKVPNYEEARRLTNQYILQHKWDFEQDTTQEFLVWLGRRF